MHHALKTRQSDSMHRPASTRGSAGFTIIELTLAMLFLSILLLSIAMVIVQISATYNRGTTLKDTNLVARNVSDDLRKTIAASEAFSLTTDLLTTTNTGRLCTGTYTYMWNYGAIVGTGDPSKIKFLGADRASEQIRLVKVSDPSKLYCAVSSGTTPIRKDIVAADSSKAQELIRAGDRNLALHLMTIKSGPTATDTATNQQLYQINFIVGTNNVDALETIAGKKSCKNPGTDGADLMYCTVQDFSLVVRAGNKVN